MYDTKTIRCATCDRCVGEIDYDAEVTLPKCGYCANLIPVGDDKLSYIANSISTQKNCQPSRKNQNRGDRLR